MPYVFLMAGLVFQVIGLALDIYFKKAMGKHATKQANELLSEYEDDDIVPEAKAKEILEKGIKRTFSLLAIPFSMHLLGTVFMAIFIIIRDSV